MLTVHEKAQDFLDRAKFANSPMAAVGHLRRTATDWPKDPTMSLPLARKCSDCGSPVWSTEVKEEIKRLEPRFKVLCYGCMAKFLDVPPLPPEIIEERYAEQIKERESS